MMAKPRVLVDLAFGHASMGFSGIPQDTRLLFAGLTKAETIDVIGMIWAFHAPWRGKPLTRLEEQAVFLGPFLRSKGVNYGIIRKALRTISPNLSQLYDRATMNFKHSYDIFPLRPELSKDLIWRNYFASTVDPSRKSDVMAEDFVISDLGLTRVLNSAFGSSLGNRIRPLALDTKGYDFVLFQDARNVRVNPGTTKIARYHDAIPVFDSDTMGDEWPVRVHLRSVKACADDSIFVCNSPSSLDELGRISPQAASKARVIPYFVPKLTPLETTARQMREIVNLRFSGALFPEERTSQFERLKKTRIDRWFGSENRDGPVPQYLMTLSTIEPRKNIPGLIGAWQRLREKHPNLRLLIVGKPGWEYENSLAAMRPFVIQGDILHLEKVAQRELRYLYSAASCFVFPSFSEGFGLPPVEAMQCRCPVVVSDIPAHRYMAGDAALFCDPYDRSDIAGKIEAALTPEIGAELRDKGLKNAARFTEDAVLPLWDDLFSQHHPARKGQAA